MNKTLETLIGQIPTNQELSLRSLLNQEKPEGPTHRLLSQKLQEQEDNPNLIAWDLHPNEQENTLNYFCLICLQCKIASEEGEALLAATLLTRARRETNPLPLITQDKGLQLCAKTLTSLALFPEALEKRCRQHGAPCANTYRKAAVGYLLSQDQTHQALGTHHLAWESFLQEAFAGRN